MTLQFFRFSKDDIFQWVSSVFTLFKLRSDEFTLVSLLYIYGIEIASSIGVIVSKYKDPVMNQSGFYIDNVMSGFLIPVSPSCTQAIFFKTQFLSAAQRKKGPWLFRVYRDCGDYFINHDTRNPVIKSNQDLNGKDWAVVFFKRGSFLRSFPGRTPVHYCALNGDAGTLRAFVDLANICSAELSLGTTLGGRRLEFFGWLVGHDGDDGGWGDVCSKQRGNGRGWKLKMFFCFCSELF